MRSTPTLAQLRAFVAVAGLQHFGDAAASLGISQPTLSQTLSGMEAKLGVRLIERNPRRVLVTADGARLLPLARAAIDAADAFATAAQPDAWLVGPFHLGVIPTVAPYLLPSLLPALQVQAPDLELHVHEDQTDRLLDALTIGAIDVAVLAEPLADRRIVVDPLYDEDFVLAVPADHPWAGRGDVRADELREDDLLFLDEGHCLRSQTIDVCLSAGVTGAGESSARAASLSTIVQLVSVGLGMTFLPDSAVRIEARDAHLGVARFVAPVPGRSVVLARRKSTTRADEFAALAALVRDAAGRAMPAVRPAGRADPVPADPVPSEQRRPSGAGRPRP